MKTEYISEVSPETFFYNIIYHMNKTDRTPEEKEESIKTFIFSNVRVKECTKE